MARVYWEWTLIGLGVIFYLFLFPHGIHGDGWARYSALNGLLTTGRIAPTLYSYVGPLFSAPLLLLGYLVKDSHWWISRFNTFLFLGMIFAFWRIHQKTWDPAKVRMLLLLCLAATMFPKHVTDYYAEVFCAVFAVLGIWCMLQDRPAWGSALIILSAWNAPALSVAAALVFLYFALRERRVRYVFCLGLIAGGIILESYIKNGEWFPVTYLSTPGGKSLLPYAQIPGFSYPLWFGLISVFLSSGKGLVFFIPAIIAVFWKPLWTSKEKDFEFLRVGLLFVFGLVIVYSRYWSWHGEYFWGPRFFLFASIVGAYLLTQMRFFPNLSRPWRVFWLGATALSLWVGCQGILFGQDFLEACAGLDFMCLYVPEYSVLWRFFIVQPPLHGRKIAYFIYFLLVAITVLWQPTKEFLEWFGRILRNFFRNYIAVGGWRF